MDKLKKIDRQLEALDRKKQELLQKKKEYFGNTEILCSSCNKAFKIKDAIFLLKMWYVEPYSCTGGDYYKSSDETSSVECVHCKAKLYLYKHQEIVKLKEYFKEIVEDYKK